jgi:hypothetical protein
MCNILKFKIYELIWFGFKNAVSERSNLKKENLKKTKPLCLNLIDYLLFYIPLKNFSLIWIRHHYRWRAAKFRPKLDTQGLWAGRDLYRATPAVTRDLGLPGLIRRTAPFSHHLRHKMGCDRSILMSLNLRPTCTCISQNSYWATQGGYELWDEETYIADSYIFI